MATEYGVIGLGIIGYGMASNLRKKLPSSHTLYVFDLNQDVIQRLINEFGHFGKIEVTSSAKELATKVRTVLSSLPAGPQVRKVYLDPDNGVIAATKDSGRLLIECSTIEIESTQELGKTIFNAGLGTFVDATVSGGMWGANAGTLSFMVGHAEPTETDLVGKRIFETLSLVGEASTITFCGGLGMGQVAKIAHNYITLANNLVATEGMAIGLKYGIDKNALFKCIREGTANSWVMGLEQPVPGLVPDAPSSNNYRRAFAPALSVKDLTIGIDAAKKVGISPTAGEAAIKAFRVVDADPRTHDLDHTSLWLHVYGNLDEWAKEHLQK
ncbi:NAD binding domain of 6-phosphogluconate dehydrogenase-domain-containing protein [Aspergillus pseudotamarii]|uniref:NAD binding domain of 6-phosphogluconate dehydrogenase-domain-containing protein n=1 Tax=Aspergillus pseudotamarii TaxID=132259 RepID=A0A5N6T537_ASPPS|nr:NAD binding domain of 6-phosphogluconate dehydrogenase-domain-containing protein [Aspergillus pseudotamarii]KAE8141359.1 NAD binding domain of 6-phosphogluconate dehydrogenase-domain-containing protein [Aspergillus pseudotamarii]